MPEPSDPTVVRIFTAPEVSCGSGTTWASAVGFIRDRLRRRFGEAIAVEHIEIFSQRSFEFPAALEAIRRGAQLPLVLVEDRVIGEGPKLSESRIARVLEALGMTAGGEQRSV